MTIKKYTCIGLMLASSIAGGYIGHKATLDKDYRIMRNADYISLHSISSSNSYIITEHNRQTYLGDSEHNLRGVKVTALYEGKNEIKPIIKDLQEQVNTLENRIRMRRITDGIENLGDGIKDAWRNIKHNTIK
jgi:hypothetical protein